jgi:hypothetical protein
VYPGTPLVSDIVDPDWSRTPDNELQKLSGLSSPARFQRQQP